MQILNLSTGTLIADAIEVADTSAQRRRGLLGRKELSQGEGLWIWPCEAIHTFGMQMKIDVLFLSEEFQVVKIVPQLPPRRLAVCMRASSVLELQAGAAERSGIRCGHHLAITARGETSCFLEASEIPHISC